jgi:hypothetical protein
MRCIRRIGRKTPRIAAFSFSAVEPQTIVAALYIAVPRGTMRDEKF